MIRPLNKEIARICFASLVLDYEFEGYASGRVLVDGWYKADIVADSVESLITKFENHEY